MSEEEVVREVRSALNVTIEKYPLKKIAECWFEPGSAEPRLNVYVAQRVVVKKGDEVLTDAVVESMSKRLHYDHAFPTRAEEAVAEYIADVERRVAELSAILSDLELLKNRGWEVHVNKVLCPDP